MASRTRLVAVTAATLALVAGASAAVSAQPGEDDPFAPGRDWARMGDRMELRNPFRPGRGFLGDLGRFDGLVRQETTYEGDDGIVTRRVDNGTLVSAADTSVDYSLADGEVASATIDDDTEVIAFDEQIVDLGMGGLMRRQLAAQSVEPADIAAGSEVVVWAESQDDGSFLAQRIVVQPVSDADSSTDADADTGTDSGDAVASPAPVASPASA
jgi:hypothetical protein